MDELSFSHAVCLEFLRSAPGQAHQLEESIKDVFHSLSIMCQQVKDKYLEIYLATGCKSECVPRFKKFDFT